MDAMRIDWALMLMFFEDVEVLYVTVISAALWVWVLFTGIHWLLLFFILLIYEN